MSYVHECLLILVIIVIGPAAVIAVAVDSALL